MTPRIREELKKQIAEKYPSKRQFALQNGLTPNYLEAVLSGEKLKVPDRFEKILDALDLELVVQPKNETETK